MTVGTGAPGLTQIRTRRDVCWLKDGLLHFATVYRAPGDNLTTFLSELSKDVLQFQNVVIGGDFNVHMRANGDKNLDENGRMVLRWCRDHGLTVLNKTALCRGRFSRVELKPNAEKVERSTVDYVLISNDLLPSVLDLCIDEAGQFSSDHRPLVLTLRRPRTPATKKRVVGHYAWRVFTATEEQTENFTEGLEHAMDGFIRGMLSADAAVEAARATSAAHVESLLAGWYLQMYQTGLEHIGRKKVRQGNASKSWFSVELRKMRASVDAMRSAVDKVDADPFSTTDERTRLWEQYNMLHRQYLRAFRRQKSLEELRINSELYQAREDGDLKLFWVRLKQRKGFFESKSAPVAICDGDQMKSGAEAAEVWRGLYAHTGTAKDEAEERIQQSCPLDDNFRSEVERKLPEMMQNLRDNPDLDSDFTLGRAGARAEKGEEARCCWP